MNYVELGFLEECESWQVESRLFPSKLGGKPAWLSLCSLPKPEQLLCKKCQQPMIFLCQIYAPYEENDLSVDFVSNFHRMLFVFVCRNPECCERNNSDNIKVFRSNLQRNNVFYSSEPPEEKPDPSFALEKWVTLCDVCGCLAEKQCSKCKVVHYCSKEHQVIDWKEGHKRECGKSSSIVRQSKILFHQMEIIKEPEEIVFERTNVDDELEKFHKLELEGKTGTMTEVSESDLESHASVETDKAFTKFRKKMRGNPFQVIRYSKGGDPLWIANEPLPSIIPNCEYCGGQRRFEFQIMPQMLSIMNEYIPCNLDWGVIAVFTCEESCAADTEYRMEYAFKQDVQEGCI